MPKSMTGYGAGEGPVGGGRLHVDLRSVNHRHLNQQIKVPGNLLEFEGQFRELIRSGLKRGHVTLAARWIEEPEYQAPIAVNVDRAKEVIAALEELRTALDVPGEIDLTFVARQPDVLTVGGRDAPELAWPEIEAVAREALTQLTAAREREGAVLQAELRRLLGEIGGHLQEVEAQAPQRVVNERDRLRTAVAELLEGKPVSEDRLAQEIAFIAEKLDITEEIVRLKAHLDAAAQRLAAGGAMGKELSFLGQEMLREINTMGSKANDATIAHAVIAMKGELEKFREQIENLE